MRPLDWLDNRTGYRSVLHHLLDEQLTKGTGWFFTTGSVLLFLLGLQFLTGVTLAMYYVPAPSLAYDSVRYIMDGLPLAWLVRGLHVWGASFAVVAAGVHLTRVFLFGSYKAPREVTWITGLILLLVIFGFALSGYLLPWDQKAYWATTVTINIVRSTPVLGEWIADLMRAGPAVGALTLGRWYVTHVFLLPAAVLLLTGAHLALIRRHGVSGPIRSSDGPTFSFFPWHAIKDTLLIAAVFALLFTLAVNAPPGLEEVANPADTGYDPRPEWYFLALFQLLKYVPGTIEPLATIFLPALIVLFLVALPFLDRGNDRHPLGRSRRVLTGIVVLLIGAVANLTFLGMRDRPARYDPNDWGPMALVGYEFVTSEDNVCAGCHVADGPAAALTQTRLTREDSWVMDHMMDPEAIVPGPPSSSNSSTRPAVKPRQAEAILAYFRRIRAGAVPPQVSEVDRLATKTFSDMCVTCHRISGEGGQSAPNLSRVGARRDSASIQRILRDPALEFDGATMPIFSGRLSEQQVAALTQYLVNRR